MSETAVSFSSEAPPYPGAADERELLRFTTAGSVDDGKSTLIGRLLFDSAGVYEDQLDSVRKLGKSGSGGVMDFALLTDGLRAEREQGITIDVAYRYFSTPKRKFIIADTPGHEQYTRNMVTGASTAHLAVILVDARYGVLPQSRRHAYIADLLGIRHIVVAINKMDLVGYSEEVFEKIRSEFAKFASRLRSDLYFVPISALHGDNVVIKSANMEWYQGATLLHFLETVHVGGEYNLTEVRFPVQYVIRPDQNFRGYAGQLVSGIIRKGMPLIVLPSGQTSKVKSIVTLDGELDMAFAPMSITVTLEDELDVSRGDMLVEPSHQPEVSNRFDARIVWMNAQPLELGRNYIIKHTAHVTKARVSSLRYRMNINNLEREPASSLQLNEIGAAVLESHKPLFFDPYGRNRATGSFILIDPLSNLTVGAGMITGRPIEGQVFTGKEGAVTAEERTTRAGHKPCFLWLEAPEEVAEQLERRLFDRGCLVTILASQPAAALPQVAVACGAAGLIAIFRAEKAPTLSLAKQLQRHNLIHVRSDQIPATTTDAVEFLLQLLVRDEILRSA
jgi:sulfate adenylyltransferase large subunit